MIHMTSREWSSRFYSRSFIFVTWTQAIHNQHRLKRILNVSWDESNDIINKLIFYTSRKRTRKTHPSILEIAMSVSYIFWKNVHKFQTREALTARWINAECYLYNDKSNVCISFTLYSIRRISFSNAITLLLG